MLSEMVHKVLGYEGKMSDGYDRETTVIYSKLFKLSISKLFESCNVF